MKTKLLLNNKNKVFFRVQTYFKNLNDAQGRCSYPKEILKTNPITLNQVQITKQKWKNYIRVRETMALSFCMHGQNIKISDRMRDDDVQN